MKEVTNKQDLDRICETSVILELAEEAYEAIKKYQASDRSQSESDAADEAITELAEAMYGYRLPCNDGVGDSVYYTREEEHTCFMNVLDYVQEWVGYLIEDDQRAEEDAE